LEKQFQVPLAD